MSYAGHGYMPLDGQLFRRSMAEALADLLSQKHPTAKHLARAAGIDIDTAKNLRKGHLSVTTLQKVLAAEGRDLWNALGDELFGETFYQYEERRLTAVMREAENARSNLVRLRARREELLAGAPDLDEALAGSATGPARREASRTRSQDDRGSDGNAPSPESVEARTFAPDTRGRP